MNTRFFKLILSEEQLETIEVALDTLSPGDDEAEANVEAAKQAIKDLEEVR